MRADAHTERAHSQSVSHSLLALALALTLPGCPHFQPDLAVRPTPYAASSPFALASAVTFRPDLDDHRLSVSAGDPSEQAAAPVLVTECLATELATARPFAIAPAGAVVEGAFSITLSVTLVTPGWTELGTTRVSASASAPRASAAASAPVVTSGSGEEGLAAALLEIRAPDGTPIDRVRIFAQRFPREGEPLEARAAALCRILASETEHYLAWRIAGNG